MTNKLQEAQQARREAVEYGIKCFQEWNDARIAGLGESEEHFLFHTFVHMCSLIDRCATVIEANIELVVENQQTIYQELEQLQRQISTIEAQITQVPLVVNIETPRHHGYVYVVQADNNLYKIGKSKDPHTRIQSLGVRLPYELEVLVLIESTNYTQLEKELHKHFADKRKGGEWFELDENDLEYIKSLMEDSNG